MTLGTVVAVVPAKDACPEIADTVRVLRAGPSIAYVVVIDDGSNDQTATIAAEAGARVLVNPHNLGKAAALRRGIDATPDADVYLLVDADTGTHAAAAIALLEPLREGLADLVIGVLPSAGTKGGFGLIKRLAADGVEAACGFYGDAPLSGQRAVKASVLRDLEFAPRFGLEVGMTIDAVRNGARVVERTVDMDHRHRGRRLAGFAHRGRQGVQIAAALWPRVVPKAVRRALLVLSTVLALGLLLLAAQTRYQPPTGTVSAHPARTVVNVVPGWKWGDVPASLLHGGTWGSVPSGPTDQALQALRTGSNESDARPLDVDVRVWSSLADALAAPPDGAQEIYLGTDADDQTRALHPLWRPTGEGALLFASSSTKHRGVVDVRDIAPTVLAGAGQLPPEQVQGHALTVALGSPKDLQASSAQILIDNRWRPFVIAAQITLALFAAAALVFIARGAPSRRFMVGARCLALAVAAVPLASYGVRWLQPPAEWGIVGRSTVLVALVVMIIGMAALAAPSSWVALRRIFGATIALLLLDVFFGTPLQFGGIFGSDPTLGSRYYGIGNPASVLLLTATVLFVTMHVEAASNRRAAVARGAALLLVVTVADGLPGLGSDVGGMLAFSMTAVCAVLALGRVRVSVLRVLALAAFGLALFIAAGLVDATRSVGSQTHLGSLFDRIGSEGLGPFWDVVERKVQANLLGYAFPWSLLFLALILVTLIALLRTDRWSNLLPATAPARSGAMLALVGGLLLYALNDSGIVVLALVSVYLLPFVLVQRHIGRPAFLGKQLLDSETVRNPLGLHPKLEGTTK